MELNSPAAGEGEVVIQSIQQDEKSVTSDVLTYAAGEVGTTDTPKEPVKVNGENMASLSPEDDIESTVPVKYNSLDVLSSGVSSGVDEADVSDTSPTGLIHPTVDAALSPSSPEADLTSSSRIDAESFDEVDKGMPSHWLDAPRTSKTKLSKRECFLKVKGVKLPF